MALAYRTSAAGGNTVSGTSPTVTLTPAVGDLFIVFCQATGNTNATPTCSDANTGGTYTLVGVALSNSSANTISAFVRTATVPNTTSTTVTVACGAHTAAEVVVYALSGATVYGSGAIQQFITQANQASSTTPTPTFTNKPNAYNLILSAVGNITNPAGITVSAGSSPTWTRDQNVGQTACGLSTEHTNNQLSTKAVTWGSTSASAFASFAIEVVAPPTTAGVNDSKLVAYGLLAPPTGVDVSKLVGYVLPSPPAGVDVSKLVAYAVLTAINTNPPVWPTLTFPSGFVGNAYSYAWDLYPAAPPTTYTVNSGSLPTGTTLNSPSADLGNVSGTPTGAGVYSFTLLATNTYGTAVSPSYSITISAPSNGPVPVGQVLAGGVTGTAYSETITADGGTGPYTFAVIGGALPTSTSLNTSTGVISGTPTVAGTYNFTIQVTDANALTGSFAFRIIIASPAVSGGGSFTYAG